MKSMEDENNKQEANEQDNSHIEELFEKAEAFGKTSLELYRLKAIEKLADVSSNLVSNIVIILCFALFFMMLNVGLALWIGDLLGTAYLGFLIVAGFYLLLLLVVYALRDSIIKEPISKSILDKTLN